MAAEGKTRLLPRLAGDVCAVLLRIQSASWRVEAPGFEVLDRLLATGAKVLVVFWHGKYIPLFTLFRGRRACILASRSVRGEIICSICRRLGYDCLQLPGPPGEALEETLHLTMTGSAVLATALDGPLGPRHQVRRGLLRMASAHGFVLLPVSLSARRCLVLRGRWDLMELPAPFTRIHMAFGDPLSPACPRKEGEEESLALRLKEALDELDRLTEERIRDNN